MRKDIIMTALLTFCLTATLFMIAATNSQTEPAYDPWADYNADGTIDIFDIVPVALTFGTAGDSTKNVTIAGHASKLAYNFSATVGAGVTIYSPWILADGYSRISVCIYNTASNNYYTFMTRHSGGSTSFYVEDTTDIPLDFCKIYEVPNQEIRVLFHNSEATSKHLSLDVYLIP